MECALEITLRELGELSSMEVEAVTDLVNRANAERRELFPGDRLGPNSLAEGYQGARIARGTLNGNLVAAATFVVKDETLWIFLLAVDPAQRRHGFGEKMLSSAAEEARRRGLPSLTLDAVDQGAIIRYYISLGFEELERKSLPQGYWESTQPFELVRLRRRVD